MLPSRFFTSLSFLLAASACAAVPDNLPPRDYNCWLEELKTEMRDRGISQKTLEEVYSDNFYKPNSEVVKIDRRQTEFVLTFADYANRLVGKKRVETARRQYKLKDKILQPIAEKYGVPKNYLIAFWGMESNFGSSFGKYPVVKSLTILSYDKRRPVFFRNELYNALKILDDGRIKNKDMLGSWAGAMGHFQFMPSTYNAYGVDYTKDGRIDIWADFIDAAASAANYLSSLGWNAQEPWGMEVSLPKEFDYAQSGINYKKNWQEWQKMGIKAKNGSLPKLSSNPKASLLLPDGKKGKAYLVLPNFNRIMQWNRSINYALSIGILADYTASEQTWRPIKNNAENALKTKDVLKVQNFINKTGRGKLEEDGLLGAQTRAGVVYLQKEAKLPADGYPDKALLQWIADYTSSKND